jgi:hypothetical protein
MSDNWKIFFYVLFVVVLIAVAIWGEVYFAQSCLVYHTEYHLTWHTLGKSGGYFSNDPIWMCDKWKSQ